MLGFWKIAQNLRRIIFLKLKDMQALDLNIPGYKIIKILPGPE